MMTNEAIDVAGIEFVQDINGERYTYDINGTPTTMPNSCRNRHSRDEALVAYITEQVVPSQSETSFQSASK